jgi:glutaredoxin
VKYEIWTMQDCFACAITKELFREEQIEFTEKVVFKDFSLEELERVTGKRALPSIFIDGKYVGNSDWVEENLLKEKK